jgi:hypothetical protein
MEGAYETMSDVMLAAVYGDADRDFKPAIFLGTAAMQHYQIAIAGLYTTTPQGVVEGGVPTTTVWKLSTSHQCLLTNL